MRPGRSLPPLAPAPAVSLAVSLAVAIAAAACGHTEPFHPADTGSDTTFARTDPVRLTFSEADDRTATWTPDGGAIVYSAEQVDRPDGDRCLAQLPGTGGSIRRLTCGAAVAHRDSIDVLEAPAVSADGRIAYLQIVSMLQQHKHDHGALMVAPFAEPGAARAVATLPFTLPSGQIVNYLAQLRWAGPTRLVALAQRMFWEGESFLPDTTVTGLEVIRVELDPAGGPAAITPVPNTAWASSVALDTDPDVVYYTLGGDSKVYRQSLATGEWQVVYDAGSEIVREVQVHGTGLVAIIGRSVVYRFEDAQGGFVQRDEGGDLLVADLATGAGQRYPAPPDPRTGGASLFRRPALSPDGARAVVEVSPFAPPHLTVDKGFTATNHRPDLWLLHLP